MEHQRIAQQTEEYKELRAEIRHYLSRRQNTRNFAYLVTLGVLGSNYITSTQLPVPTYLLPPLLILSLWADEVGRLKAIQRIGTYIKIFIEAVSTGYQYETLGLCPSREITPVSRFSANMDYPILYIALVSLSVWKFSISGHTYSCYIISILFLMLGTRIFYEAYIVAKKGVKNEELRWLKAKKDIADGNQ